MPAAGVAIFKGHFTIHQITQKTVALWVFLATADEGHMKAQSNLGFMNDNGRGVDWSDTDAMHWLRVAADQANAIAQ